MAWHPQQSAVELAEVVREDEQDVLRDDGVANVLEVGACHVAAQVVVLLQDVESIKLELAVLAFEQLVAHGHIPQRKGGVEALAQAGDHLVGGVGLDQPAFVAAQAPIQADATTLVPEGVVLGLHAVAHHVVGGVATHGKVQVLADVAAQIEPASHGPVGGLVV